MDQLSDSLDNWLIAIITLLGATNPLRSFIIALGDYRNMEEYNNVSIVQRAIINYLISEVHSTYNLHKMLLPQLEKGTLTSCAQLLLMFCQQLDGDTRELFQQVISTQYRCYCEPQRKRVNCRQSILRLKPNSNSVTTVGDLLRSWLRSQVEDCKICKDLCYEVHEFLSTSDYLIIHLEDGKQMIHSVEKLRVTNIDYFFVAGIQKVHGRFVTWLQNNAGAKSEGVESAMPENFSSFCILLYQRKSKQ